METVIQTKTYRSDFSMIKPELLLFERHTISLEDHFETDVFPNYWSVAFADLAPNTVALNTKQGDFPLIHGCLLILPPHSTITWKLKQGEYFWAAFMVDGEYPEDLPKSLAYAPCDNTQEIRSCQTKSELTKKLREAKWTDCSPPISKKIKIIHDKIHADFKSDTSFEGYAQEINVSLSYLSRQFSKELHIGPLQFRNKLRCMQVLADLLFKGTRVSEACFENGFQDVSHFNTVFKNIFKVTPSEFLKLNSILSEKDSDKSISV